MLPPPGDCDGGGGDGNGDGDGGDGDGDGGDDILSRWYVRGAL